MYNCTTLSHVNSVSLFTHRDKVYFNLKNVYSNLSFNIIFGLGDDDVKVSLFDE